MSASSPNYFLPGYIKTCEKAGMLEPGKASDNLYKALTKMVMSFGPTALAEIIIALNCLIAANGMQAQVTQEIEKIMKEIEGGAK